MRHWSQKIAGLAALTVLGASLSFAAAPKKPSSKTSSTHHSRKKSHKTRGQQAIDSERCREIQEALVREHYMTGKSTGKWDDATQAAMRRYQADQGWQNKTVPDSRALIRLGLGPDHEHLLNPETAMTNQPQLPHGTSVRSKTSSSSASVAPQTQSSPQTSLPVQNTATPVSSVPDASPSR